METYVSWQSPDSSNDLRLNVRRRRLGVVGLPMEQSDVGALGVLQRIGAVFGGVGSDNVRVHLPTNLREGSERSDDSAGSNRYQEPIGDDWRPWFRLAIGTLLFYAGCLLAYRSEFSRYRLQLGVLSYVLITGGLICGFWDRLWS
jgi:hypothetical protein